MTFTKYILPSETFNTMVQQIAFDLWMEYKQGHRLDCLAISSLDIFHAAQ